MTCTVSFCNSCFPSIPRSSGLQAAHHPIFVRAPLPSCPATLLLFFRVHFPLPATTLHLCQSTSQAYQQKQSSPPLSQPFCSSGNFPKIVAACSLICPCTCSPAWPSCAVAWFLSSAWDDPGRISTSSIQFSRTFILCGGYVGGLGGGVFDAEMMRCGGWLCDVCEWFTGCKYESGQRYMGGGE